MNFGAALEKCLQGYSISRKGGNGKGQFVYLISGQDLSRGLQYGYGEYEGEPTFTDVLAIKTAHNQIQVGWLASQSDMLAEDWYVVGGSSNG